MPGTLAVFSGFCELSMKSFGCCFGLLEWSYLTPFSRIARFDTASSGTLLLAFLEFWSLSNFDLIFDFPYSLKWYYTHPSLLDRSGVRLHCFFCWDLVWLKELCTRYSALARELKSVSLSHCKFGPASRVSNCDLPLIPGSLCCR